MRNYVIINGVNSLTIQGLAINILPTITKAPMRTMREEIDGRDGDITTNLGYGAYDKTLEIGLFGNYNVDDVIAFFNTKGQIIFSDEDDKVYNFEIVDQIDFAKLIKFRTATINIHCQPFKYPLNETPIEKTYEFINGTGTSISLSNTANAIFGKIDLKGNSSQTGTPTPTNPIKVDVVNGDNIITIGDGVSSDNYEISLGMENLIDYNDYVASNVINGITFTNNEDGTFSLSGTATANTTFQIIPSNIIKLTANQPYFLYSSKAYNSNTFNFSIAMSDNGTNKWLTANGTYTPTSTPTNVRLQFYIASGNSVDAEDVSVALIKSTSNQRVSSNPIELCKIGNAQDYIHKIDGGWVVHREIQKVVLNGTENWTTRGGGTTYAYVLADFFDGSKADGLSSYWYFYSKGATNSQTTECLASANTDNRLSLFTNNSSMSSVDNLKTWLSSHNVDVYYTLITPIEEAIEDNELINQLDLLAKAKSYEDTTNIAQTNNDLPFILDVSAIKKGSDQAIIVNDGNIYSKPTINLIGNGVVSLYLEGVQMFQVDLSNTNEITIDTDNMEALDPNTLELANRLVVGDYSKFKLEAGSNNLSVDGNITSATFTKYTRWL